MGTCLSTTNETTVAAADAAADATKKPMEQAAVTTTSNNNNMEQTATPEKPKPMIFAIMRNGHEVLRGALRELQVTLDDDDGNLDKAVVQWKDYQKWVKMHMAMEEGVGDNGPRGFFRYVLRICTHSLATSTVLFQDSSPHACVSLSLSLSLSLSVQNRLLDEHCDGVASKHNLHQAHEALEAAEVALQQAFDNNNNLTAIQQAFSVYRAADEQHLQQEEQVMMPKVQKMVKDGHPMVSVVFIKEAIRFIEEPVLESESSQPFVFFCLRPLKI